MQSTPKQEHPIKHTTSSSTITAKQYSKQDLFLCAIIAALSALIVHHYANQYYSTVPDTATTKRIEAVKDAYSTDTDASDTISSTNNNTIIVHRGNNNDIYTHSRVYPEEDSVILASYFTKQRDVHYNTQIQPDRYNRIKPFYESVTRLGMKAIIFHDSLSPEFVSKYQTPNITFHMVEENKERPVVALCSLRFFVYEEYLRNKAHTYRYVLATDLFDVVFRKNVFKLFEDMKEYYDLFIQKEEKPETSWGWLSDRSVLCTGSRTIPKWPPMGDIFYSCGLIGGKPDSVLPFFHTLNTIATNSTLIKDPIGACCDMLTTNHAIYTFMSRGERSRIMSGYPYHSLFFSRGNDGSDSFVAHK